MKRFKYFLIPMILVLAFCYWQMATDPPTITRKIFKYPHWTIVPTAKSEHWSTPDRRIDIREIGSMTFRCYDTQGNLKWEEIDRPNVLADEGEQAFLDIVLRNGTEYSNFYLRLFNDTPVDTDTIGSLTGEPSGNGYTAQTVEQNATGWPTLALDSGDYQATSSTETFSASGAGWGPVTYCVLTTSTDSSGKLFSYVALSQSRTLAAGESLQVTYKLKLQ